MDRETADRLVQAFKVRERDARLGGIAGCDAPNGMAAFVHGRLDIEKGRGAGFSLEAPEGVPFPTGSRAFNDAEAAGVGSVGEPPRGGA